MKQTTIDAIDAQKFHTLFALQAGMCNTQLINITADLRVRVLTSINRERLPAGTAQHLKNTARDIWESWNEFREWKKGITRRARKERNKKIVESTKGACAKYITEQFRALYRVGSGSWAGGYTIEIYVGSQKDGVCFRVDENTQDPLVIGEYKNKNDKYPSPYWDSKVEWSANSKWSGKRSTHRIRVDLDAWLSIPTELRTTKVKGKEVLVIHREGDTYTYIHQGRGFEICAKRFSRKHITDQVERQQEQGEEVLFS